MKATPFLMACTFFLGALLTIVSLSTLNKPVSAQDSGSKAAQGAGVTALAVQVGSGREFLVVIKEVPNMDPKAEESMKTITSMAVYDFTEASAGNGKGSIALIGGRFMEYDLRLFEYNNQKGEKSGVNEVQKKYDEFKKYWDKKKDGK